MQQQQIPTFRVLNSSAVPKPPFSVTYYAQYWEVDYEPSDPIELVCQLYDMTIDEPRKVVSPKVKLEYLNVMISLISFNHLDLTTKGKTYVCTEDERSVRFTYFLSEGETIILPMSSYFHRWMFAVHNGKPVMEFVFCE